MAIGCRAPGIVWPTPSLLVALAAVFSSAGSAAGGLLVTDDFAYPTGPLAGNGGGTGWQASSTWTGGTGPSNNQVAAPLPGTNGQSIRIASNASPTSRPLSVTYTSGGATTYFISFGFNAAPFQGVGGGGYAGVSFFLASGGGNSLFIGMPGDSGGLGFDWSNRAQTFAAAQDNTTYLVLVEIAPSTPGNTSVMMYVTTDLAISGTALAGTTPWDSATDLNFSFDTVDFAGNYSTGTIGVAGLAMADNPDDAVAFTQIAVPEPGTAVLVVAAVVIGGSARLRSARRRMKAARGRSR